MLKKEKVMPTNTSPSKDKPSEPVVTLAEALGLFQALDARGYLCTKCQFRVKLAQNYACCGACNPSLKKDSDTPWIAPLFQWMAAKLEQWAEATLK